MAAAAGPASPSRDFVYGRFGAVATPGDADDTGFLVVNSKHSTPSSTAHGGGNKVTRARRASGSDSRFVVAKRSVRAVAAQLTRGGLFPVEARDGDGDGDGAAAVAVSGHGRDAANRDAGEGGTAAGAGVRHHTRRHSSGGGGGGSGKLYPHIGDDTAARDIGKPRFLRTGEGRMCVRPVDPQPLPYYMRFFDTLVKK